MKKYATGKEEALLIRKKNKEFAESLSSVNKEYKDRVKLEPNIDINVLLNNKITDIENKVTANKN